MNYSERLEKMANDDMAAGDIMVADNIYTEYKKGESLFHLGVKYEKSVADIKRIIEYFGEKFDED